MNIGQSVAELSWLWLAMFAAGAITFTTRLSFIILFDRLEVPKWLIQALRFVPTAVLTAIILPELLIQDNGLFISVYNTRLLAGGLAVLVAWRTRNTVLTIIIGMVSLWALQWLIAR